MRKCADCKVKPVLSMFNCVSGDAASGYEVHCPGCYSTVLDKSYFGARHKWNRLCKFKEGLKRKNDVINNSNQ